MSGGNESHTAEVAVIPRCPKLRYVLPRTPVGGPGWTHVQVAPWTFESVPVGIGFQQGDEAVVQSGLKVGDRVVVKGGVLLND